MLIRQRSSLRVIGVCGAILATSLLVVCFAFGSLSAGAASRAGLQQQIAQGQDRISHLSSDLGVANGRLRHIQASLSTLQGEVARLQALLDTRLAQLATLRHERDSARVRLGRLEAYARRAQGVLAQQLVGTYEFHRPDLVSVVLEASGFRDLLERIDFARRIRRQDENVVTDVRAARRAVAAQAVRLGALEVRAQAAAAAALSERDQLYRAKSALVDQQIAADRARGATASQLASARRSVAGLRRGLLAVMAAQAARRRADSPSAVGTPQSTGAGSSSPAPTSASGGFTFPLPKAAASSPGTWSLDDGVDISAPGGTPEFAVCSGTVVLHGIGGFGPSAPVLHCDSSVSGYAYVYYGHAGPGNWTPVGAHVAAGQAISEVGSGIVGISSGPHLEIGFADASGAPVGPSTASAMMSLLRSSYGL
jgi:murein DD-endopeptidase MepM/ murein hydrolase activator NlpD